jgi:hypothetical protein
VLADGSRFVAHVSHPRNDRVTLESGMFLVSG